MADRFVLKGRRMADTPNDPYALLEGVDYYFEGGRVVFTAHFLRKRNRCCENGCRHCPYRGETKGAAVIAAAPEKSLRPTQE
jgi:hypothetical protein